MPSTYTVNLGIEKPATGEQSGTWGDTTNVNFDILDQAINGAERVTLTSAGSSGSPNSLQITNGATSDGRNKWLEFYSSSDLGGSAYVQLDPNDAEKIVFVRNSLAGSQSVILFQGTYNAARDLEVPAGVDMVVKFDGGGASAATVTDVFTKLRATEITTPTLTAGTADINGGTVDGAVIGGSSAAAITGTTVTANTSLNIAGDGATVTGIKDEDDMSSNSPTKLATQQSIKAYVDSQVGTVDTWAEVLANGATSGSTNPEVTAGQALKTNTINETSAGSGVTIDSVLLKDDVVNATDIETGSISANDGTAAATIANSTGNFTITNFISNSVDIGGGAIDGTNIGASSAGTGAFTTLSTTSDATLGNDILMTNNSHIQWGSASSRLEGNSSGTDTLKLYTNSTENLSINGSAGGSVVVNEGSSNLDFRVESTNNANMLFVDAGTDRVGVGTNAPVGIGLTVNGGTSVGTYFYGGTNNRRQLSFTSFDTASLDAGHEIKASSVSGRLLLSASSTNHLSIDAVSNTTVFNEGGTDQDFRIESDTVSHMLFVDAGSNHVNIGTSTDLGGLLNVGGSLVMNGADLNILGNSGSGTDTKSIQIGHNRTGNGYSLLDFISDTTYSDYGFRILRGNTGANTKTELTHRGTGKLLFNATDGGNEIVFNEVSSDTDFRVESDNYSHMLFVNAGTDVVTIGGSDVGTHAGMFNVAGDLSVITGSGNPKITIKTGGTGNNPGINYRAGDNLVFDNLLIASAATDYWRVGFGTSGTVTTEVLTVNTSSRVGIQTTEPDSEFHISGSHPHIDLGPKGGNRAKLGFRYDNLYLGSTAAAGEVILKNNISSTSAPDASGDEIARFGDAIIFNEGSRDQDFRVESNDNANMIFVDAGSNEVGIGTGDPEAQLHVNGAVRAKDMVLIHDTGYASIEMGGPSGAYIDLKAPNTDDYDGRIITFGSGMVIDTAASSSLQLQAGGENRIQLDAGAEVIVNTNGLDRDFRVESDGNAHMLFVDGGNDHVNIGTSSDFGGVLNVNGTIAMNGAGEVAGFFDLSAGITHSGDNVVAFSSGTSGSTQHSAVALWADDHSTYSGQVHLVGNTSNGGSVNAAGEVEFWTFNGSAYTLESYMGPRGYVFNESSRNVDFRVESDSNTHQLAVDAGKNNVQINNSNVVTNSDNGSVIVGKGAVYYNQVLNMPNPYTGNVQIDLDFSNWGSNNTIAAVDVMILTRQFNTTSGIAMGKMFATNSGSGGQFVTFTTTDITTSNCTFTASSPNNYRLRLTVNPSNITDLVSIVLTIPTLSTSGLSEITAQIV